MRRHGVFRRKTAMSSHGIIINRILFAKNYPNKISKRPTNYYFPLKQSLQRTGLPCVGLNGTVVALPQSAQTT